MTRGQRIILTTISALSTGEVLLLLACPRITAPIEACCILGAMAAMEAVITLWAVLQEDD